MFHFLKGAYKKEGDQLFTLFDSDRTRGNGLNLLERRFWTDFRKKFFSQREVRHWHRLPRAVVDIPSLQTPKVRLDGALST